MAQGTEFIKNLNGHSGCNLDLYKNEDGFFVRKLSSDFKYNFRLKKQCMKQYRFIQKEIKAPEVLRSGLIEDKFFFDMEFVRGQTLAQYSSSILITEIADFIRLLFKNLYYSEAKIDQKAPLIFKKKIDSLKNSLDNTPLIKESFKILDNIDFLEVKKSPCHGDLTLENIIITKDKNIYLIDFLDSFYNSWMIDIAKLLQDLELGWSFRRDEINATRNLRLLVAKEALIEELKSRGQKLEIIYSILLLNVLRIYPYAKDEKTLLFLDEALNKIINKLNTNEVVKL